MTTALDRIGVRKYLEECDLQSLFINTLGWDLGGENIDVPVADNTFFLEAIANKRGLVVFQFIATSDDAFPDYSTRRKIEKVVARSVHEHIIIFITHDKMTQYWQWVKRESGRSDQMRQEIYHQGKSGESLIQKLEKLVFPLSEEEGLTIGDATARVRAAFDVEKVTKKFYDRFKEQHKAFLNFIEGLEDKADLEWYASLMLNRLMFIYFIQKRGFLDKNTDYLRNRLERVQASYGKDKFQTFYREFLLRLFHEGLGQPKEDRTPELADLLGDVPYLNGGLFDVHTLEQNNPDINIPDDAFEKILAFFEQYQWHLDDRPLREDNEINPDVLGYIFEKYINQKQMGAYYTKEDITGYIGRNTIIPFLFNQAKKDCSIAFEPDGEIWRLLSDGQDRYIFEDVRHGITYDIHQNEALTVERELPPEIADGINEVSKRAAWNAAAPDDYALPTETWREHVARRQRYEEIRTKLAEGEITSINDLVTYNLDIEKFARDVLYNSEGPELLRAFWKALNSVSILDPTCGSGAFLFAALNILEPLYTTCLEVMGWMLDDLEHSKRKRHIEPMEEFRKVRTQVKQHANARYFILKSIIVNNLYGVDIMEEAVEICKLRLFLKLVAQLETYRQLEPLPDIDFNVRPGNTLVGFASLTELKEAFSHDVDGQQKISYEEDKVQLNNILKKAGDADAAFSEFRNMQTDKNIDVSRYRNIKRKLQEQLDNLRKKLDRYLADQYETEEAFTDESYKKWRNSHQPFHWFVEFYGIMVDGGFDVIIGNPPYKELKTVTQYEIIDYECKEAGNLYAVTLERSLALSNQLGRQGFIVPVSSVSTDRYSSLQDMLTQRLLHYSSFNDRPSRLFDGLEHIRLTIHIISPRSLKTEMYSTKYNKWTSVERPNIFHNLSYEKSYKKLITRTLPKLCSNFEYGILEKLENKISRLAKFYVNDTQYHVYYTRKAGYFLQFLDFIPSILNKAGKKRLPSELKTLCFESQTHAMVALCCLNSNLFYWFYTVYSDCRNVNKREIDKFPVDIGQLLENQQSDQLVALANQLMKDFRKNSVERDMNYSGEKLKIQCVFPKYSKNIIDKIDRVLAKHYGFTEGELDFIINYDIKYRMRDVSRNSD